MILRKLIVAVIILITTASYGQSVSTVDAIGFTVSDIERAVAFYTTVLPFQKISETEIHGRAAEDLKGLFGIRYKKVRLRLGSEEIELTDYLTQGGRPIPVDSRSNDLWFQHIAIVVSNMDSAYARLRRFDVAHVSTAPQTLPKTIPQAEGIRAFYFRDPDGHNLELIFFPEGKGDRRWHVNKSDIFLGIDHTAIGVSRTFQSRMFYNELLGIGYKGESFNFGEEQEHLNNVAGAKLHISGNRATDGPGVEFLEYTSPRGGRKYPADARPDDLVHWETIFVTDSIDLLYQKLKNAKVRFISNSIAMCNNQGEYKRGFYVRDPDGHALGIFEKVK
jgi:catechol 2,3-dioxygenase-like lactoylglutathione lyase family enzyme